MSGRSAVKRLQVGSAILPLEIFSIHQRLVQIPDPAQMVHLQFRRFAGCPICDLHLRSVVRRHAEIAAAGIREVVVFHSTRAVLLPHAEGLPFDAIADPEKRLYAEFGVESAARALLDPRAWLPLLLGVLRSTFRVLSGKQPLPEVRPHGGSLGLPADFLLSSEGRVIACRYGEHAYDQWSVDEMLELAGSAQRVDARPARPSASPLPPKRIRTNE
ncbi:peroxiredoxin-like family protein [Paludibaculum fermentans]|uniref:peroxiredoxin-like family protein n=1 Tax=Paludibaculum fermentans TaxID=1473598 RepID=UPI003EC11B53